jgi:hypothetical protein
VEIVGGAVFGVVGGFGGYWLTPSGSSAFGEFAYPTIGAGVGVVLGFLIVFTLIFLWNLFRAPYKLLDQATIELQGIQRTLAIEEQKKQDEFTFEFDAHSLTTTAALNKLFLGVSFFSPATVIVENLYLEIDGKRVQPINWTQFKLKNAHRENYEFNLPEVRAMVSTEKKDAQFVAIVDGQEHRTRPFKIHPLL